MLLLDFPGSYLNISLFDPANYASSWLNPSLGDLLLNTVCSVIVFGMIIYHLASQEMRYKVQSLKEATEIRVFGIIILAISSMALWMVWVLPRDIISNSQWALDISSIPSFDWFKGLSFLILFLWGAIYVLISLTFISLILEVAKKKAELYKGLLILGLPVAGVLLIFSIWGAVVWLIHLLLIALVIRFELFRNVFKLGFDTFLTFFFACLITAGICGISTFQTERNQLIQSKIRFANQNLIENDVMTEFFLSEIFTRIKSDLFIQNRMGDPLLSKDPIETKIRKIYLDNYFDQFEVKVGIYSSSGQQMQGGLDLGSLNDLRLKYINSDFATSVKDLYFIRGSDGNNGNQFIAFIPLSKDNASLGTIFLELNQLRVQPTSVYPKLLLDKKYSERLDPIRYDYAVFRGEELLRNTGSFNYLSQALTSRFGEEKLFEQGIHVGRYHHFGIRNGEDLIIISSPNRTLSHFFGNISLYFVAFVFLTFLTILINTFLKGYKKFEFNYSTKLQLYLNFAFFFPIIIISIITIGLLANSYREDLDRQYIQKANLIRGNLTSFLIIKGRKM
ncbi:hypothetical protein V8V91_08970 [Algoriphagus halophilus]|uniref:hypothetical protein n=1 Tax=Algoriphagus halophilus TaxID=226505 RepID=UPI00358F29DF